MISNNNQGCDGSCGVVISSTTLSTVVSDDPAEELQQLREELARVRAERDAYREVALNKPVPVPSLPYPPMKPWVSPTNPWAPNVIW